jgi:hypothetical protein
MALTCATVQASEVADLQRSGASVGEQRAALETFLAERGVSEQLRARVADHTRPGIVLERADRPTRTCLGGSGLLPADESWPVGRTGHPLGFIGAFDLGELPPLEPLPSAGTVLFYWDFEFYEYEHMDFVAAARVYYVPQDEQLVEHEAPKELWAAFDRIPLAGSLAPIAGEGALVVRDASEEERGPLVGAMNELVDCLGWNHHLLGSTLDVQGPALESVAHTFEMAFPETRARFTSSELAGDGWMLLAQINEDEGLTIADGGALYFLILEDDLRARRFDRVIGDMQCH